MIRLAWKYGWSQPWTTVLNLLLMTLGLGLISFIMLISEQLERGLQRNLAQIDLVVGAKGSPMQIMLSGVFHLDVPTGNIPFDSLARLRAQPLVAEVIPLSLGDAFGAHRIVGTTAAYADLYGARLAEGRFWDRSMQAVLGAETARLRGVKLGDRIEGSHGLAEGGDIHDGQTYLVVGILAPTGTVLDRLVLTDLQSVWDTHEHAHPARAPTAVSEGTEAEAHADDHEHHATDSAGPAAPSREITMVLVKYRSPLAAAMLPRWVNAQPQWQAAAPAMETARLMRMFGNGLELLQGLAWVVLGIAALSVLITLTTALRLRHADLAMLRMLGAPPWRLALLLAIEAGWLALMACALGWLMSHGLASQLGSLLGQGEALPFDAWSWSRHEWLLPPIALLLAWGAAAWPAWRAYRMDVSSLLQSPR